MDTDIDKLLKLWEGLGYYQRVYKIKTTAENIIENYNSQMPNIYAELIGLDGVGDYTASAILSIAFNKPYPAIDGNLKRVVARVYAKNNNNEFDSFAKAIKAYESADYQEALKALDGGADRDFRIFEGL